LQKLVLSILVAIILIIIWLVLGRIGIWCKVGKKVKTESHRIFNQETYSTKLVEKELEIEDYLLNHEKEVLENSADDTLERVKEIYNLTSDKDV